MKSLTFPRPGQAVFTEKPMPLCGEDNLLLRTRYSGMSNGTERSFEWQEIIKDVYVNSF
ncbi:MAG: hypothetical protein JJU29_02400 [Verrucomicrobia bacterium]|nr:hypothetical protein [Verrucomicrobiota bacterium]MCH8511188.1 hypothetical protein [Kiritimatiellia bacterium]